MELVINIEEKIFEELTKYDEPVPSGNRLYDSVLLSIYNGTPLPEHHGRLIDADALEKKMCDREEELGDDRALWESSAVSVALDMFAPTIIEGSEPE